MKLSHLAFIITSFIFFMKYSAICQSSLKGQGITASWFSFKSKKQEIYPYFGQRPDASVSSVAIISYEARIEYNRMLSEHIEISLGALSGAYPFGFHIAFDSSFSIFERTFDEYTFDRYSTNYVGLNMGVRYLVTLSEKQFISTRFNLNYIFFITQYDYYFSITDLSDKGTFRFFESTFRTNKEEKGFFAPEFSVGYHYRIGKYFIPYLSFNSVYSKNYPIDGVGFKLKGENETLEGNFKRRFMHTGIAVGVKVNLPSKVK